MCFLSALEHRSVQPIGASVNVLRAIIISSDLSPCVTSLKPVCVHENGFFFFFWRWAETKRSSCVWMFMGLNSNRDPMLLLLPLLLRLLLLLLLYWEDFSTPDKRNSSPWIKATQWSETLTSKSAEICVNKQEEPRRATSWAQTLQLPHR